MVRGLPRRDGVASFFEAFGSAMEVDEFTPLTFAETKTRSLGGALPGQVSQHWKGDRRESPSLLPVPRRQDLLIRGTEDSSQTEAALRD